METKKGTKRISWKKKFVGQQDSIMAYKQKLIELHNELAKVNLKYGLLRGESFHTKRTVRELKTYGFYVT